MPRRQQQVISTIYTSTSLLILVYFYYLPLPPTSPVVDPEAFNFAYSSESYVAISSPVSS